jgi:hypothetical protein
MIDQKPHTSVTKLAQWKFQLPTKPHTVGKERFLLLPTVPHPCPGRPQSRYEQQKLRSAPGIANTGPAVSKPVTMHAYCDQTVRHIPHGRGADFQMTQTAYFQGSYLGTTLPASATGLSHGEQPGARCSRLRRAPTSVKRTRPLQPTQNLPDDDKMG